MTPKEALDQRVSPDLTKRWAQPVIEAVLAAIEDYHREQVKSVDSDDGGGNEVALCKHEYLIMDSDWMICNFCGDVKPIRQ